MTGKDIIMTVAAVGGLVVGAGFWVPVLQAIQKGEFRQAPRGSRRDTWLMVAGLAMTLSFGSLAYVEWQDPWHLYDTPRLSIDNAHGWALALAFSSLIPLGLVFVFAGCYGKLTSRTARSDSHDPSRSWEDIPPASRAECQVLLKQLKDDALWAKGNEAVAAYLLNIMLRNMNSWDSDAPLWEALQPELKRRFSTQEQREAAVDAIQSEYTRLFEERT